MPEWIYPNKNLSYDPRNDQVYPTPRPGIPQETFPLFPFPIAPYPSYDSQKSYEQDMKYLISLYPEFIKPMLTLIRTVSDRYDHPGTFLYDRYPDKESLLRIVTEIYDELAQNQTGVIIEGAAAADTADGLPSEIPPELNFTKDPRNPCILTLIQILLSNELLFRRQNQNNRSRYWYGY